MLNGSAFLHLAFLGMNFGIGKGMGLSDPIVKEECGCVEEEFGRVDEECGVSRKSVGVSMKNVGVLGKSVGVLRNCYIVLAGMLGRVFHDPSA